jgi:hypothetical protein
MELEVILGAHNRRAEVIAGTFYDNVNIGYNWNTLLQINEPSPLLAHVATMISVHIIAKWPFIPLLSFIPVIP